MKKLIAVLLSLVLIGTCAVGLANNSSINGFLNNTLDAMIGFNIDSQAIVLDVYDSYSGEKYGDILLQKQGGTYQIRFHDDDNAFAMELNSQLVRVQITQTSYRYGTQTQTIELRYSDLKEIVDNLMGLLDSLGSSMSMYGGSSLNIDLDAIGDIDYGAIIDSLVTFLSLAIQQSTSVGMDQAGNTVARICVNSATLLEAADQWIDLFLQNTSWQNAYVDMYKVLIDGIASMLGNFDEDMEILGDLNLGDFLTREGLCDAVRQLRDKEFRQELEKARANPETAFDLKFAVNSAGEFAYLTVDVGGSYGSLERVLDARYEGSDLVIKSGSSGSEKIIISSTDSSRIDIRYEYNGNVYWTGYATQTGGGNNWKLEVHDTYSAHGSPNSGDNLVMSLRITGTQPFDSLANDPNLQRIDWNWIMENALNSLY